MAIIKRATFSYKCSIKALNTPQGEGWDIYNLPNQIKTASKDVEGEDLGGFDLKQATKEHPDHLYIKIFAIKKDEPNDNGDAFDEHELKEATSTFVGVPLFTNHQNDDVEKARGECVHSWYDDKEGGVYIIGRIDKIAYPRLARGIEEGYIKGSSMGCFLGHNRVLMGDGSYKSIYKVKKDDEVITHKGRVRKVKNLQIHEDKTNDLIYRIKVEGLPNEICATKEHPFYVLKEQTECYITGQYLGSPKSMKNKYRRRTQQGVYQKEEYQVALKNGELNKFDFKWKRSEDLKKGDMVSFPISREIVEDEDATIEKARLIGYFLAEGSYLKYKGEKTAVEFNLCLSKEKDTLGREIISLLRYVFDGKNEPKIQERPDRDILMIRLYGREVAKWFYKYCGEYSYKKMLNKKCLFWDPNIQKHILAAWINGDGCCRNIYARNGKLYQNVSGTTCSEVLHNQMKFISYRLGIYSTTEQIKEKAIERGKKPYWNLVFGCKESQKLNEVLGEDRIVKGDYNESWFRQADDYIVMPIKNIKKEYNIEPVYNIEVEEDHSYIVEGVAVKNCSVEASLCSVCHNKANIADDYCSHISNRKNRKYTGEIRCAYHNSPTDRDDKCPLCKSAKDSPKILKHSEQAIFEHNYGLKFIENSFVVNPACHTCGVKCVLHVPTLEKKVAYLSGLVGNLIKESCLNPESEAVKKIGGVKELDSLKGSMNEMELVVKSMLQQKENVSMEYVSDLVKAMADIQGIFDELVEMGYGGLPSPEGIVEAEQPIVTEQFPEAIPPQNLPPQATGEGFGNAQTSDLGGLGNVTMPKNSSKNKEDFDQRNQILINKVSSLEQSIRELYKNINSQLDIGAKMATENKKTKTAAGADNLEVITEKQLMKQEETLHPRTDEVYEGITESKEQIAGSEKSNDTTSESPQVRKGTYETITEDQLKTKSALGDAVIHFVDYPDVITEKQWNDFSRDIAGDLPDDYTESITQAQIRNLLSKHKFIGDVETITEDQLRDISMTDGHKRWANKDYSLLLVKTATNLVADAVAKYRKSPEEIKKTSSVINDNSDIKSKVSFLAVVNSLPRKRESREAVAANAAYFSKTASQNNISSMDALIMSAADNAQFGIKAEDLFDTVNHIVGNEQSMKKVDEVVKNKLGNVEESKIVTKADALNAAIRTLDKPEDGHYRIKATMEDIGVPITDKEAFVKGVKKFAQEMINDNSVAVAVIKIEATEDGTLIIDVQDGSESEITSEDIGDTIEGPIEEIDADINGEEPVTEECSYPEDKTKDMAAPTNVMAKDEDTTKLGKAKTKIEKKAQMMGGEMGGQGGMGQGPGAGASLPAAPPMDAAPMENLSEEGGFGEEPGMEDTAEPLPPGSICPVCGSDDVDIIGGKGQCNNCSSEMTYKVEVNVTKWQGVTPSEEEMGDMGEEGFEGEGFEMPTEPGLGEAGMPGEEMGEIPAAASTNNWKINKFATVIKLQPEAVKKVASKNIKIGTISPATGKTNTIDVGEGSHICLDTGTKYKVSYMVSKDGKQVYGQWEWQPKVANALCPSCSRAKQRFIKALSTIDMTQEDFNKAELKNQVETIIKLKQSGALRPIKTASKEGSVLEDYKLAYGQYGDNFPVESCIEKLSRRFGKEALCLSGPDEGKPLAESVCNRLKKADVYTDKIAIKLADNWSDCDGDEECITHQVRSGYGLRQAAEICSALKIAVADGEDFLTDDIAGEQTFEETPMEDSEVVEDVDPFAGEGAMEGETVTLELPIDVLDQLGEAVDMAQGEVGGEGIIPGEEAGIPGEEAGIPGEEAPIEESLAPEELETKPAVEPGMEMAPEAPQAAPAMGGGEMKPSMPGQNLQDQVPGGEMKPVTPGSVEFEGDLQKNKGVPQNPQKVVVNVDESLRSAEDIMVKSIGKVGKAQMDLSHVIDVLNKQAGEKEITQEKAQDSKDIGPYSAGEEGSKMGHESDTIPSAGKPTIPRDNATMGQEPPDLNPQDKPQPVIPSDDATMGHEKEVGLGGGDNRYTGGDKGQGKTELASGGDTVLTAEDAELYHMRGFGTAKAGVSSLAERIAKKLAPKEPVAKDSDIQPISGNSTIGKEDKFTADEVKDSEVKSESGMMGHENETLGSKPDSPKDHPDVFTGNAQQGKEELDSEKTTKDKGTVIAESDSESEAIRVAGLMLQTKKIEASDLPTKIGELKQYKPEQIRDIEKAIFANDKGLNTVEDGKLSQTVQINETSSVRNGNDELATKIAGLFTLGKQNQLADEDNLTQLRQAYKK